MDWMDGEAFDKSMASYRAAIDGLLAISPRIETEGNDHWRLPINFRMAPSAKAREAIRYATVVHVGHQSLFDYGRPKIVAERSWLWGSRFFEVSLATDREYELYRREPGIAARPSYVDDDGNFVPAAEGRPSRLVGRKLKVTLAICGRNWGLSQWRAKADEIRTYLEDAPADVREEYRQAYEKADAEVQKWEAAIQELAQVTIPGAAQ